MSIACRIRRREYHNAHVTRAPLPHHIERRMVFLREQGNRALDVFDALPGRGERQQQTLVMHSLAARILDRRRCECRNALVHHRPVRPQAAFAHSRRHHLVEEQTGAIAVVHLAEIRALKPDQVGGLAVAPDHIQHHQLVADALEIVALSGCDVRQFGSTLPALPQLEHSYLLDAANMTAAFEIWQTLMIQRKFQRAGYEWRGGA